MPSIRIRSTYYPHIRDLFHIPHDHDEDEPSSPVITASPVQSTSREDPSSSRDLSKRAKSMPQLKPPIEENENVLSPVDSLAVVDSVLPLRRPRSETVASRIRTHVLDRSRDSRTFRQSTIQGNDSSTEALNVGSGRPTILRVEGAQADVLLDNQSVNSQGLVEHAIDDRQSTRRQSRNHHDDIVEHLDAIDPQVGTVSNLTNAANSILLPPSNFYSRKPVIVLAHRKRKKTKKHSVDLEKLREEQDPLDEHVEDLLEFPSKIRRTFMGVWSFLKTPLGILTGIYGFLVVFWGAAIVFFLAKFINLHNADTQGFWVEVSSQVVCGLFTATSVGFIPSRVLTTFRIYKIWRYKKKTIKRRKEAGLPQLFDTDDLPDPEYDPNFVHVLTDEEHHDLHRQQVKFAYHETWYRAHGTETHRAFPISTALWICFLNDLNSVFQIILCGTMWGMNRFQRPAWSTGILIPAGFISGIAAGVLIWRGGERTKRVEEVRERLRAVLAKERQAERETPPPPTPSSPPSDQPRPTTIKFADSVALDILSDQVLDKATPIHEEKASEEVIDKATRIDEEMVIPKSAK
ncbi:hypothetical protein BKA70DRAFT_575017 [Coprinopsis sp. MPI-PUGE-AT-0042]|nr:hypothetical protein BKA70DRAFT_575017 [Coprinopsis sp. MPI-PUGE-AT-0042]